MRGNHVAGFDGCPGGWICARWDGAGGLSLEHIVDLTAVLGAADAPRMAAIDIPIGLPDSILARGRSAEREARPLLGQRQSSVFSVPSRSAVEAAVVPDAPEAVRYRQASALARATSEPPRSVSKQAFHLFPKIMEVDAVLRANPQFQERLHECHPEVSFWAMNGTAPLALPKKVKGRPDPRGMELRIALLATAGLPVAALNPFEARRLGAGLDDLLDACAAAWTAHRIQAGTALSFPNPPERDRYGLPIAIRA